MYGQLASVRAKSLAHIQAPTVTNGNQLGRCRRAQECVGGTYGAERGNRLSARDDFTMKLARDLELEIEKTLTVIRGGRSASVVNRSHNSMARCRGCTLRTLCDESLL